MAGRPRRQAKLVWYLVNEASSLSKKFNEACPTAYKKSPRHYRRSGAISQQEEAHFEANYLWFCWHDALRAIQKLEGNLLDLADALDEKVNLAEEAGEHRESDS